MLDPSSLGARYRSLDLHSTQVPTGDEACELGLSSDQTPFGHETLVTPIGRDYSLLRTAHSNPSA